MESIFAAFYMLQQRRILFMQLLVRDLLLKVASFKLQVFVQVNEYNLKSFS